MDQPDRPRTAREFALAAAEAEKPPYDPEADKELMIDSALRLVGDVTAQSPPSDPTNTNVDQTGSWGLPESDSHQLLGGPIDVDAGMVLPESASGELAAVAADVEVVDNFDSGPSSFDVLPKPLDKGNDTSLDPIVVSQASWNELGSVPVAAQTPVLAIPTDAARVPSAIDPVDRSPLPPAVHVAAMSPGSLPSAVHNQSNPSGVAPGRVAGQLPARNLRYVLGAPVQIERGLHDPSQNVHPIELLAEGGAPGSTVPPPATTPNPPAQGAAAFPASGGPPVLRPILLVELSESQKRQIVDDALAASLARDEKLASERADQAVHDEMWKRDSEDRALWGDY